MYKPDQYGDNVSWQSYRAVPSLCSVEQRYSYTALYHSSSFGGDLFHELMQKNYSKMFYGRSIMDIISGSRSFNYILWKFFCFFRSFILFFRNLEKVESTAKACLCYVIYTCNIIIMVNILC